jgi:uncharacterized protein (TIGR02466 family)
MSRLEDVRWEAFPCTFATQRLNTLQPKKEILPVIEKDIEKSKETNPNWRCSVYTDFHKPKSCLDKFKKNYTPGIKRALEQINIGDVPYSFNIEKIWYNVYENECFQESHIHYPDHFSFIHYLEYDPEEHSPTVFENPNLYAQLFNEEQFKDRMFQDVISFPTYEGTLMCFPSNVRHFVPKNKSNKRRVTVSFNVKLDFSKSIVRLIP